MSTLPLVAIVGRPNVGKSTLFNVLTRSRDAIVSDQPGVTRDRQYGVCRPPDQPSFIVIDTGGIGEPDSDIAEYVQKQALAAIEEAPVVVFMVEATGLNPADYDLAAILRRTGKHIIVAANKSDGIDERQVLAEMSELGLTEPHLMAARSGRGIPTLISKILDLLPADQSSADDFLSDEGMCRIAIIGRPNVGKSTLVNRLLGEERVLAYDKPGTTRDAIDIPMERDGQRYLLIDTAGIRRQAKVRIEIERHSVIQALRAVERAQVAVLIIDAKLGPAEQDSSIVGHVLDSGKALVIALNKWDGLERHERTRTTQMVDRMLDFVPWAKRVTISALHGSGLGELLTAVHKAQQSALREFSTNELTEALHAALEATQPPMHQGRTPKIRYVHQGGRNPPRIIIHGTRLKTIPLPYQRYLENFLRKRFKMVGTPIRLELRDSVNPYAGKYNELTDRQVQKKRRLIRIKR